MTFIDSSPLANEAHVRSCRYKIDTSWEADEIISGWMDKQFGRVALKAHSLREVPGNTCFDASRFIVACDYYLILIGDGSEIVGMCKNVGQGIDDREFFGASTFRGTACSR
jgi:hypothetical protein